MRSVASSYRSSRIHARKRGLVAATAAVGALTQFASLSQAVTSSWVYGTTDNNWSDSTNWSSGVPGGTATPYTNADLAIFTGSPASLTPTLDSSYDVGAVMFGATAVSGAFTLGASSGSSLILTGVSSAPSAPTETSASGNQIVDNAGVPAASGIEYENITAPIILANTSGTNTGVGSFYIAANGGSTNSPNSTNFLKITGNITGSASTGNKSTLTLYGGNNTRGLGGNEIDGIIADGVNGGSLALAFQQGNQFGTNGSTTWILAGANTYSGGTLINTNGYNGMLQVNNSSALGTGAVTWTASGGNFNSLYFGTSGLTLANNMTVTGSTAKIDTGGNSGTLSGVISGAGNVQKVNGNTLTLTGASTYTGTTTINSGTLAINNGGTSSTNSAIGTGMLILAGGNLDNSSGSPVTLQTNNSVSLNTAGFTFGGSNSLNLGTGAVSLGNSANATETIATTANTLTLGGAISNGTNGTTPTINLTKSGSGTLVLNGANLYTGLTTISAGSLILGSSTALGTGSVTIAGGTLDFNGNSVANLFNPFSGAITNSGAAIDLSSLNSGTSVFNGLSDGGNTTTVYGTGNITLGTVTGSSFSFALVKNGSNTLTMAGTADNSFLNVTVNSGTLIANKTNTGHVANNLTLNGGTVQYGSGTVSVLNGTGEINGVTINGGTFDLNGQTNIGDTTIGALAGTGGVITNNSSTNAATLTVGGNNPNGGNYSGVLQNGISSQTLAFAKTGTGTAELSGVNTFSGSSTVSAGTLLLGSSSALGTGTVAVGTATLDFNGQTIANNFTSVSGGTLTSSGATAGGTSGTIGTGSNNPGSFAVTGSAGSISLGTVTGNGAFTLTKYGSNTLYLSGTADNSFLAGQINAGVVVLNKSSTSGGHAFNNLTISSGTAQFGGNIVTGGGFPTGQINGTTTLSSGATLDLNGASGQDATMQVLTGAGGTVTNSSATPATLSLRPNGAGSVTFAGVLQNGTGGGVLNLIYNPQTTGTTTVLTGSNTYTGSTTVSGGTLTVNADSSNSGVTGASLAGSTAVSLSGSGTLHLISALGGTGSGASTVSLLNNSVAITVVSGTPTLDLEFNGNVNPVASFMIGTAAQSAGIYGSSAFFTDIGVTPNGTQTTDETYFTTGSDGGISVTPEPGSLALLGLASVGMLARRKRRATAIA